MTTSIVECPHCHYKFNYEFIPGASFYSIRLGPQRLFRCPNCKHIHRFTITHFGTDPSLSTHGDNSETGLGAKIWALMLGPSLAIIFIGIFLQITFEPESSVLIIAPVVLGILWIVGFVAYLIRKSSQYKNETGK